MDSIQIAQLQNVRFSKRVWNQYNVWEDSAPKL